MNSNYLKDKTDIEVDIIAPENIEFNEDETDNITVKSIEDNEVETDNTASKAVEVNVAEADKTVPKAVEVNVAEADKTVPKTVEVNEVEMDEMWSFYHDKSRQEWLWWAVDHNTGEPLAYCFGTREYKYLNELKNLLKPFKINIVYSDNNFAYKKHIRKSKVITGKKNTQRIERNHLSLRTFCSRLVRKSIRFSKSKIMHEIVVGLVINFWFFGRILPFHLI